MNTPSQEGAIKKFRTFELTLFLDIELRKSSLGRIDLFADTYVLSRLANVVAHHNELLTQRRYI